MLRWLILWCVALVVQGGEIDLKLILDGDRDLQKAQIKLYQAKILFLENEPLQKLQQTYQLTVKLEHVQAYHLVVVAPIQSKILKEKLMIYGVPYYRRALFIKAKNAKVTIPKTNTSLSRSKESAKGQKGFLDSIGIGVEWIAIWFLSVLGLILSVRRRHTIANLRDVQNEISETEEKIKKEIQSLEV